MVLGAEGADALMEADAGEMLARGRSFDAATVSRELAAIDVDRVRALARRLVQVEQIAGAVCGPEEGIELPPELTRLDDVR